MDKCAVKACTLEDVVNIGPAATYFARKPCRGSLLTTEFVPNKVANMYHCDNIAWLLKSTTTHQPYVCGLKKKAQGWNLTLSSRP